MTEEELLNEQMESLKELLSTANKDNPRRFKVKEFFIYDEDAYVHVLTVKLIYQDFN